MWICERLKNGFWLCWRNGFECRTEHANETPKTPSSQGGLLLFRPSAESSNAQDERLATSPNRWQSSTYRTQYSDEVACALTQRCYPHTKNSGLIWCLSSNPFLSVGFSILDEAMGVAQSAQLGHYFLAPLTRTYEGSMGLLVLWARPTSTRIPANIFHTPVDNTPLHSIPSMRSPCVVGV